MQTARNIGNDLPIFGFHPEFISRSYGQGDPEINKFRMTIKKESEQLRLILVLWLKKQFKNMSLRVTGKFEFVGII